jgi:rhodanese-related sulfurtransferase
MSNKGDAHMNLLFALSSVLLIGTEITVASAAFAQGLPPAVAQKVQAAQKQVKTIGMEEYRKVVENPGGTLIVDVREPQEYAAGHVPGAINIPRGVIEFKIWSHVGYPANTQMDQPIVLQCQSGNRASLAAQSLADLGFTHINAVVMSLDDWQKSGHPFVK